MLSLFLVLPGLNAEDTTEVQVLTFDDISKRRTVASFPDAGKKYRKILMYYRLKCDPATPWDQYNCGEWDYLAYTKIYKPTGQKDSTKQERFKYKIGNATPSEILLSDTPGINTYIRREHTVNRVSISDADTVVFDEGEARSVDLAATESFKMQLFYDRKDIREKGINKILLNNIMIFAEKAGRIKNLTVRLKTAASHNENGFDDEKKTVFFQREFEVKQGWNELLFFDDAIWNPFNNILLEISGEKAGQSAMPVLAGYAGEGDVFSEGSDVCLDFDGNGDAVECGEVPELAGAEKCTFEALVKIDKWSAWSSFISLGGKTTVQTGGKERQLYAITRSKKDEESYNNIHGNTTEAIQVGRWTHIAMVFDGTAESNDERLKLYVNGEEKILLFNNTIPSSLFVDPQELQIGSGNFTGSIDEVRIFSEALPQETIIDMMTERGEALLDKHPNADKMIAYYSFDSDPDDLTIINSASDDFTGEAVGIPVHREKKPYEYFTNARNTGVFPKIKIIRGKQEFKILTDTYKEEVYDEYSTLFTYKTEGRSFVEESRDNVYRAGMFYTYHPDGVIADSTYFEPTRTVTNEKIMYYEEPIDVLDAWEIGRFITPYGINFDLGPEGFLWIYDMTDYAEFLKGDVEISAHNTQELIDLKFLFIEGTPPRDIVSVDRVWGPMRSYKYKDMDSDKVLDDTTHVLKPETKGVRIKTRLTGHGHNRSNENLPHCCEWKDNEHTLLINGGEETIDWHIWREDCGINPVGNQGGTWPGSREGWCPGDLVRDYDFELTDYIKDGTISIDYAITPVPENNPGMGNGNYVTAMHLIQYGEENFDRDAEIYQIITPNNWRTYVNRSLLCDNAVIVVRNNGKEAITDLEFEYFVSGNEPSAEKYVWEGSLLPHRKDTIELPIPGHLFWFGDEQRQFTARIIKVNKKKDQYSVNDEAVSGFSLPDMYDDPIIFELKTNLRGDDFSYRIVDLQGNEVFNRSSLKSSTVYRDTLYGNNCYLMQLEDERQFGLSYWAVPAQGNGSMKITDIEGNQLKRFDPDCGKGYQYPFNMEIDSLRAGPEIELGPTPCTDKLTIASGDIKGHVRIDIYDISGKRVLSKTYAAWTETEVSVDVSGLAVGAYYMIIKSSNGKIRKKFIKA